MTSFARHRVVARIVSRVIVCCLRVAVVRSRVSRVLFVRVVTRRLRASRVPFTRVAYLATRRYRVSRVSITCVARSPHVIINCFRL
jgi:hypothetical protein